MESQDDLQWKLVFEDPPIFSGSIFRFRINPERTVKGLRTNLLAILFTKKETNFPDVGIVQGTCFIFWPDNATESPCRLRTLGAPIILSGADVPEPGNWLERCLDFQGPEWPNCCGKIMIFLEDFNGFFQGLFHDSP